MILSKERNDLIFQIRYRTNTETVKMFSVIVVAAIDENLQKEMVQ